MTNIPQEEAMTSDNFDADTYKDKLREQGFRDDVLDDMVAKKKASLQKDESNFEYVMKLEQIDAGDDLIVAGYASSGSLDYDDEAINKESLQSAWSEYMKNPVLRYMHGKDNRHPDAIGQVIPSYTTPTGRTVKTEFIDGKPFIVAKISNASDVEDIRTKIGEGILKGFSIGGRANKVSEFCHKMGKNVNRIFVKRLSEISIVDLPANKEGFFEVVKGCVGNNCACELIVESEKIEDNNYEETNKIVSEDEYQINKGDKNMGDNIEMELPELVDLIKSTVSDMITDQETVEKTEGYDAAIAETKDLRKQIADLEAKVTALAAQLKAAPQEAMKSEEVAEVVVEEVVKGEVDVAALQARIAELEAKPVYKAEQTEAVEKTEVASTSMLGDIIKANFRRD